MGRLLFVAGFAIFAMSAPALAKPDHAKHERQDRGFDKQRVGYGAGGCPPGLKKKNAQCMPPGRYKKLFEAAYPGEGISEEYYAKTAPAGVTL